MYVLDFVRHVEEDLDKRQWVGENVAQEEVLRRRGFVTARPSTRKTSAHHHGCRHLAWPSCMMARHLLMVDVDVAMEGGVVLKLALSSFRWRGRDSFAMAWHISWSSSKIM